MRAELPILEIWCRASRISRVGMKLNKINLCLVGMINAYAKAIPSSSWTDCLNRRIAGINACKCAFNYAFNSTYISTYTYAFTNTCRYASKYTPNFAAKYIFRYAFNNTCNYAFNFTFNHTFNHTCIYEYTNPTPKKTPMPALKL